MNNNINQSKNSLDHVTCCPIKVTTESVSVLKKLSCAHAGKDAILKTEKMNSLFILIDSGISLHQHGIQHNKITMLQIRVV